MTLIEPEGSQSYRVPALPPVPTAIVSLRLRAHLSVLVAACLLACAPDEGLESAQGVAVAALKSADTVFRRRGGAAGQAQDGAGEQGEQGSAKAHGRGS